MSEHVKVTGEFVFHTADDLYDAVESTFLDTGRSEVADERFQQIGSSLQTFQDNPQKLEPKEFEELGKLITSSKSRALTAVRVSDRLVGYINTGHVITKRVDDVHDWVSKNTVQEDVSDMTENEVIDAFFAHNPETVSDLQ